MEIFPLQDKIFRSIPRLWFLVLYILGAQLFTKTDWHLFAGLLRKIHAASWHMGTGQNVYMRLRGPPPKNIYIYNLFTALTIYIYKYWGNFDAFPYTCTQMSNKGRKTCIRQQIKRVFFASLVLQIFNVHRCGRKSRSIGSLVDICYSSKIFYALQHLHDGTRMQKYCGQTAATIANL